jgi:hypothetical protein
MAVSTMPINGAQDVKPPCIGDSISLDPLDPLSFFHVADQLVRKRHGSLTRKDAK